MGRAEETTSIALLIEIPEDIRNIGAENALVSIIEDAAKEKVCELYSGYGSNLEILGIDVLMQAGAEEEFNNQLAQLEYLYDDLASLIRTNLVGRYSKIIKTRKEEPQQIYIFLVQSKEYAMAVVRFKRIKR